MDLRELQELIRLLEESTLQEIEIEEDNRRIRLNKGAPAVQHTYMAGAAPAPTPPIQAAVSQPEAAPEEESPEDDGLITINSPMIGTFYAASAPGEAHFVSVGDQVKPDQTVCIVEAMKIMNEVPAKVSGVVERLLVENGEPVEFGQPLFAVRPA